ncbi:hypothetical protein BpHYR1_041319 [Brachionus plicatilis]|uniref:EGF-like domain-containing protein n=1 Tax=Brachionus plicatilis TaxID=10195 RepID=A0A3M7Q484_BRAPC|nr:hypothetical protein BpHYR1_041319 [Brachionus plicatilis]
MKNNFRLLAILIIQIGSHVTQKCSLASCKNQGALDPVSCSCVCLAGYSGVDCTTGPDCRVVPSDPAECSLSFCSDQWLKALCPRTCLCPEPISDCTPIVCKNYGVFDNYQCKCTCLNGFTGNDCSLFDKSSSDSPDPQECEASFCYDEALRAFCPKTCN